MAPYPKELMMRPVRVTFTDGRVLETSINGTDDEIRNYYVGQPFNFGDNDWGDPDNMQRGVSVEFLEAEGKA